MSLKLETGNDIPLKATAIGNSRDNINDQQKEEKLQEQPGSGPTQSRFLRWLVLICRDTGGERTVLSCESDEVNIEVDLIGLA